MRLVVEGEPQGARSHFFCALDKNPPARILSVDLLDWPSSRRFSILETGTAVVEEVMAVLPSLGDHGNIRATMTRLLVTGYLIEAGAAPSHPTSHVGEPDKKSSICDFCSGEPISGRVESRSFWHYVTGEPGELPIHYAGEWAYCAACAPLVSSKNHLGLAARAMGSRTAQEPDPERRRRHFEGLYEAVMKEGAAS